MPLQSWMEWAQVLHINFWLYHMYGSPLQLLLQSLHLTVYFLLNPYRACMQTQPGDWSDQETLLLLEGLELHRDRWADIAEHVGTKSQVQCILHFLQLPIEDEYLDELEERGRQPQGIAGPEADGSDKTLGAAQDGLIAFADTGNPILSQVR